MGEPLLRVAVDISGMKGFGDRTIRNIGAITKRAGISAQRAMYAEGSRQVRARKAMKVAFVKDQITMPSSYKDAYRWAVRASGLPVPIYAFSPKPTARPKVRGLGSRGGSWVTINKGRRVLVKGAFVAKMKSGHIGLFKRYGEASRVPVQRYRGHPGYAGVRKQPIRELYTTTVANAFKDALPDVAKVGRDVFERRFGAMLRGGVK